MARNLWNIIPLLVLLSGCGTGQETKELTGTVDKGTTTNERYAEKFTVNTSGELTLLTVHTPWQNASGTQFSYLLGDHSATVPDSLSELPFIEIPVTKSVIMSTTYIGFLDALGVAHTIRGVSGGEYIYNKGLYEQYLSGEIREVGYDQQMNYELLLELEPDVVFLFGVQSGIVQTLTKLEEAGIPVVICADYLEPHPLGRAEWLKFFAAFYNRQASASRFFSEISHNYDSIAAAVETASQSVNIPAVLLGLPWKDTWYVAGGNSFAAQLIRDAGGRYLFGGHDHSEAKPFDIEMVFSRALEADVWLNTGIAGSMENILEHDQRFGKLDVFQKGAVYNNNKRMGAGGGNDYWESGPVRPDRVLMDLVHIFRDQPAKNDDLYYYRKLN